METPAVKTTGVTVPKLMSSTVGLLAPITARPEKVRFLLPAYAVALFSTLSKAVIVSSLFAPAIKFAVPVTLRLEAIPGETVITAVPALKPPLTKVIPSIKAPAVVTSVVKPAKVEAVPAAGA